jgi:hypothetical protein
MSAVSTTPEVQDSTERGGLLLGAAISCVLNAGTSIVLFYITDGPAKGSGFLRSICVTAGLSIGAGAVLQLRQSSREFGRGLILGAILGQGLP